MKSTWILNENSTGSLKVSVDSEIWKRAQEKALNTLIKDVEIQGFRKGHVPKELARKRVSEQTVMLEAANTLTNDAYVAGISEHQLEPVAQPEVDIDAMSADELTLSFTIVVKPEVELGEYKGIAVVSEDVTVSEEDIVSELSKLQEEQAELSLKEDGAVVDGDTVIIDFEGFKEDVAFEGGKGENYSLVIGSNSFIPGFEEALIGMKPEEERDIELTFPEDYQVEELKGQPVVFKVKVHEVKEKVLPELDDVFVLLLDNEDVKTLDELKASIRERLETSRRETEENRVSDELIKAVTDNATVAIPEPMVEDELDQMFQEFTQRLAQQGMNFELYSQYFGQNEAELRDTMREDAQRRVRTRLVLEKVAAVEELAAEDSEVEDEYQRIAEMYNLEVEKVKELASQDAIRYDVLLRKAVELVKSTRA